MRSKVDWASAMALAATLLSALFGTHGSGAVAQDRIVLPATGATGSPAFVSRPVVQPLPATPAVAEQDDAVPTVAATDDDADRPDTLAEFVSEQPSGGSLTDEMKCLAGAIYFEARGESLEGQLAVGRVIVNRAASGRFPSSYCGVVYQKSQFSFVRGRSMPAISTASGAWHRAVAIARIADAGNWTSKAKGALYFHAKRVSPRWRLIRLAQVDNHVFYR